MNKDMTINWDHFDNIHLDKLEDEMFGPYDPDYIEEDEEDENQMEFIFDDN